MLFNNEDCILIKNMYLPEGYTAQKLLKEFQSKSWNKRSLLAKSLEDGKKIKIPVQFRHIHGAAETQTMHIVQKAYFAYIFMSTVYKPCVEPGRCIRKSANIDT